MPMRGIGHGRRSDRLPRVFVLAERTAALPWPLGRRLAAGVGELDAEARVLRRDLARCRQGTLGGGFIVIRIEAEAAVTDPSVLALHL